MADTGSSSKGLLGTIAALIAVIVGITTIQKNCAHDPNEPAFIQATSARVQHGTKLVPSLVVNFENLGKNDAVDVEFVSDVQPANKDFAKTSSLLRHGDGKSETWLVFRDPKTATVAGRLLSAYRFEGTATWKDRITGTHGQNQWCFQTSFYDRHMFDNDETGKRDLESCNASK